jgi:hypothetical protein
LDKLTTINQYVIANEKQLKNICFKFYKGNDLWKDLFQEFYLKVIDTNDEKFERYSIKQLCYWTIVEVYSKRNRYGLIDSERVCLDSLEIAVHDAPSFDLLDKIEFELSKPDQFLDVQLFVESVEMPVREIVKKTGLKRNAVNYKIRKGREKLYNFVKDDRFN